MKINMSKMENLIWTIFTVIGGAFLIARNNYLYIYF